MYGLSIILTIIIVVVQEGNLIKTPAIFHHTLQYSNNQYWLHCLKCDKDTGMCLH